MKKENDITRDMPEPRYLGIEFGSTRIKSVVIDRDFDVVSSGSFTWENDFKDGYWTYPLEDALKGLLESVSDLGEIGDVKSMGVSAMMHGYLAFDKNGKLLIPFRTWRNTTTSKAAKTLTEWFGFNIPERWSIAHLYQAILDDEEHVPQISFVTTLAGYIHLRLTGEKVLGIGDASGMFPIKDGNYNLEFAALFLQKTGVDIFKIFPKIRKAGENAGFLNKEGTALLGGRIPVGTPFCPPEGDAGTGMVATNSVTKRTGNVSAGTSIFGMIVMERPLSRVYPEIDVVTTPDGEDVAMVHCNNCTGDIDDWVNLFSEVTGADKSTLYQRFYRSAMEGDADCGGLVSCNYLSGEQITGFASGVPILARQINANLTFANFARSLLYTAISTLRIGFDIMKNENVEVDKLYGHGGFFKVDTVGASIMASALNSVVAVMESAGEGGAFGIAVLARFMESDWTLPKYLSEAVFKGAEEKICAPDERITLGFSAYLDRFVKLLEAERKAVEVLS